MWVALSGGVDSAAAAALALELGADVTGVTLDLGIGAMAVEQAAEVAASLGIPHVVVDAHGAFEAYVVEPFVSAYASGITPNPCIMCNEHVKLGLLLDAAEAGGAERLVTGHYARIVETPGGPRIARALDPDKDQSYFLYRVPAASLSRVDLPLGTRTKREVRALAAQMGIPVAERADSQDVCFLSGTTAGAFVCDRVPTACTPGPIFDLTGEVIGTHRGLCHYTVGQRKGLPGGAGPLYVSGVDVTRNAVIAGPRECCESRLIVADEAVWYGEDSCGVAVCVRARTTAVGGTVVRSGPRLEIAMDEPVCAAPGQAAVCYVGDVIIGGGTIVKEHST